MNRLTNRIIKNYRFKQFSTTFTHLSNKLIDPILPEKPSSDHFSEMINDRTNSLFRSLGINTQQFEPTSKSNSKPTKSPLINLHPSIHPSTHPSTNSNFQSYYFSTQAIYTKLKEAQLTAEQAEIIMQAIDTGIQNLTKQYNKTSVPLETKANETYLFDAAASEMHNEIHADRRGQLSILKLSLARLQRGIEILNHEGSEMCNQLKADLDIDVFDRKNQSRVEESAMQIRIQDLNNKISTRLNSELRSEIENLRWQIIRRSLAAIAFIAASLIYLVRRVR